MSKALWITVTGTPENLDRRWRHSFVAPAVDACDSPRCVLFSESHQLCFHSLVLLAWVPVWLIEAGQHLATILSPSREARTEHAAQVALIHVKVTGTGLFLGGLKWLCRHDHLITLYSSPRSPAVLVSFPWDQLVFELETGVSSARMWGWERGRIWQTSAPAAVFSQISASVCWSSSQSVISLGVKQPGLAPKGFNKLVQSAGSSFPLTSF